MAQLQAEVATKQPERSPQPTDRIDVQHADIANGLPLPPDNLEKEHGARNRLSRLKDRLIPRVRFKPAQKSGDIQLNTWSAGEASVKKPKATSIRDTNVKTDTKAPVEPEAGSSNAEAAEQTTAQLKATNAELKETRSRNDELYLREQKEKEEYLSLCDGWLRPVIKNEFDRNEQPRFIIRLRPTNDPTSFRTKSIEVHLAVRSAVDSQRLQDFLMQPLYFGRRRGFIIAITKDLDLEPHFLGLVEAYSAFQPAPSTSVQIVKTRAETLCGSLIETGMGIHATSANAPTWTFGGLVSVQDRIYGLTVAHPYELRQSHDSRNWRGKEKSAAGVASYDLPDYEKARDHGAQLVSDWQHLGCIEISMLSDSKTIPDNSDWMLIDVEQTKMLPNLGITHDSTRTIMLGQAPGKLPLAGFTGCFIMTHRGNIRGVVTRDEEFVTIGGSNFQTITVELLEGSESLGESAVSDTNA